VVVEVKQLQTQSILVDLEHFYGPRKLYGSAFLFFISFRRSFFEGARVQKSRSYWRFCLELDFFVRYGSGKIDYYNDGETWESISTESIPMLKCFFYLIEHQFTDSILLQGIPHRLSPDQMLQATRMNKKGSSFVRTLMVYDSFRDVSGSDRLLCCIQNGRGYGSLNSPMAAVNIVVGNHGPTGSHHVIIVDSTGGIFCLDPKVSALARTGFRMFVNVDHLGSR
jgi:hypothetical protein